MLRSMVCEITVLRAISLYYLCCKWYLVTSHRRTHTCVHAHRYPHTFLPVSQGYDISFLVTNFQTEQMYKHKLVDFVIHVSLLCAIDVTVVILGYLYASVLNSLAAHCVLTYVSVLFSESRLHAFPGCAVHSETCCV